MDDPDPGRAVDGGATQNTISGPANGAVVQGRDINTVRISTPPCPLRKRRRRGPVAAGVVLAALLAVGAGLAVSRAGWWPVADKQPVQPMPSPAAPPTVPVPPSTSAAPPVASSGPRPASPAMRAPERSAAASTTSAPPRASRPIPVKPGPRIVNGGPCAFDALCFYRGAETVSARYDLPRTGDPVSCVTVVPGDPGFQALVNGSDYGYFLYPRRGCQGSPVRVSPGPNRHLSLATPVFSYSAW
ncbi:hypothetical protein [Amycolatopsis silviterrae]|uniref:Serine/threonine protein kinase n=1 Tax=Amycolatopsis silviterrae TaxID=1656914 RepID=A0ABW5HKF2_9PSEU